MQNVILNIPSCRASFIVKGDRRHTGSLEKALQYHSFDLENPEDCYALSTGFVSTSALSPILSALMSLVPPFRWATLNRLKEESGLSYDILVEIVTQTDSPQLPMQIPKECIDFLDATNTALSFVFKNSAEKKATELLYKGKLSLKGENLPSKEAEQIFGTAPSFQNKRGATDFYVYEGALAPCSSSEAPAVPFFEDLLQKSEKITAFKAAFDAKSALDLMIYPKEFFDFEASFTLPSAAIALARATDSKLGLDIS